MESANVTGVITGLQIFQMQTLDWIWFLVVALLGGFASSLVNNKRAIERMGWDDPDPKKRKHLKIGLVADLASGVAAALAILWMMTPQTFFQLLGIGAVAGYGGSSVLQALVNRMTIDISESEKTKIQGEKDQLDDQFGKVRYSEKEIKKKKVVKTLIEKIIEAQQKYNV